MSRVKEGRAKKMPWCLSCLIACLVIVVVFVVGIIIAANVTFNKFVSPMIGGVKLSECTKLLTGALNSNRKKVVTSEYTAQDLDDFYYTLNSMLYQKEISDEEYQAKYDALSEEEKAKYPTLEAYKEAHPYRIDMEALSSSLNLDELIGGGEKENTPTEGEVSAAGENEGDGTNVDNADNAQLQELFKQLAFDFGVLKEYPYTNTEEDLSYTTFQITGNQIAAVANEITSIVFKSINFGESLPELEGVDLAQYAIVPQITASNVEYQDANGNTATKPKLCIVVELKARSLVGEVFAPTLKNAGIPEFAVNIIKSLIPKDFFVSLETYPTDKDSDVKIKINNINDKSCETLKTIANSLAAKFNFTLFPKESDTPKDEVENQEQTQQQTQEQPQEPTTLFNEINIMVVNTFTKINEIVPVQFVSNEQGSVSLRVAHIQGLLKMMGLFDENDLDNSVTPHMFLTTLRCLFDEATPEANKSELAELYAQLDAKYGIDESYWLDKNLLDSAALENITDAINVTEVEFKANEDMRVTVKDGELTTLIDEAIKNGTFGKDSETPVAMAGESENNELLDMVTFEAVNIKYLESINQNDYYYIDENNVESEKINALIKKYSFEATVSVSIADLLTPKAEEGEQASDFQPIIDSLKAALPEKLCLSLVLHIDDVYSTLDGKLFNRVIAGEAGDTSFKLNKFDENYSTKVLDMIQKLINKFSSSASEGENPEATNTALDISSVSTQISDALSTTLKQLKDNLYCDLYIDNKAIVLPSVYELVHGMGKKQVETNESLTDEDLISVSEIRDLFVQVYNTDFYIVENDGVEPTNPEQYNKILYRYNQGSGDVLLNTLSTKYYMSTPITTEEILGENGLTISGDRLNFKGENGLYYDVAETDTLDVFISGDALASLIADSGKLDELTKTNENEFISALSIVTAEFEWEGGELYLNFDFEASINPPASDNTESINIDSFIPQNTFITARVAMKTDDEANLYSTDLLLNNSSIDNLVKLLNLFSNEKIDNTTLTNEIKTSIKEIFDTINENVNLEYNMGNEIEAMAFKNVFNTINKLSHKNDANYTASDEDDETLRRLLKGFGNKPYEKTVTISSTDNLGYSILGYQNTIENKSYAAGKDITVYGDIGINLQNSEDGFYFYDTDNNYYFDIQAHFFDMVNKNYYITNEDRKINADTVNSGTFVIGNDLFDFHSLYNDKRTFEDTKIRVSGNTFAALAEKFYEGGIKLSDNNSANIVQMHLYTKDKAENAPYLIDNYSTLKTIIRVNLTDSTDAANVLPEYVYMVCFTIIDPEAGEKRFNSEFIINSLGYYEDPEVYKGISGQIKETQDFIDRLNLIKDSFELSFTFDLEDIKGKIKETFRSIFEDKLSSFGDIHYENDSFIVPNVFQYLTGGQLVGESSSLTYDTKIKMLEADGVTLTDPEVLKNRLQELGTGSKYTEAITAWNGDIYNNNRFTQADLDSFFADMQAYYFLINKPTSDNLMGGSFFTDLTGANFETTFNLRGLETSEIGLRGDYISKGLYNYSGEQQSLKLSDKALAGLINSQDGVNISSIGSVGNVEITSFKLEYVNESSIDIEITIKATKQEQIGIVNEMPEVFYITTKTTRNVVASVPEYSTTIAVNAFNPAELDNLLANLNHVEKNTSFGIKNNLDTEALKTSVEDALKELFDGKLKDYADGYGSYENNDDGFGYIQFPNIYSKILETTGATKGDEVDMQNVIVKLNNKNLTLEKNKYDLSDKIAISYPLPSHLTDRQFAYLLNGIFAVDANYSYISVEQVVIFNGTSDKYADFEALIKNVNPSFTFDPTSNGYYFITVSINTSNLSCNMALAPEKLYLTLVVDSEGNLVKYTNNNGEMTSIKFAQDFTSSEMDLFLSIFADNDNKLDFDATLEENIKSVMNYVTDKSLHQNPSLNEVDFSGYYGYVGTMN